MNLATLRVEGSDSALEALKNVFSLVRVTQWSKGDSRRNGSVFTTSGFNATVADTENPKELTRIICSFLMQCKEKGVVFPNLNLVAELAIGFTVGDSKQFVAGVEFSPSELLSFSECGISLNITAYPTSDEVNAEENAPTGR